MTIRALILVVVSVGWWRMMTADGQPIERRLAQRAVVAVMVVMVAMAWVSGPVLSGLDVDTETFRIATGLSLAGLGLARTLGWGARPDPEPSPTWSWWWPVAYPMLLGPEALLVAVSVGSDHGVLAVGGPAAVGAIAALVVSQRPTLRPERVRVMGVVLMVLAVALVFDGLRDI